MEFQTLLNDYFKVCQPAKKPRTQETEASCAKFLLNYFGKMDVRAITGACVVRYRESRGVGPLRVKRELSVASAAFNWAISDLGMDIINPFQGRLIGKRERQGLEPPRKRSLTYDELQRLIAEAQPKVFQDIIVFAVNTGLRQSEITSLTLSRVTENCIHFAPEDSKTNRIEKRALNKTATEIVADQPRHLDYVFTHNGERITRPQIARWFARAAKKASLHDVRFHDLRRTCGSMMLAKGATMEAVKGQLGHLDIRTTQNNYADDDFGLILAAAKSLDATAHSR